jgi:hypothetical protein
MSTAARPEKLVFSTTLASPRVASALGILVRASCPLPLGVRPSAGQDRLDDREDDLIPDPDELEGGLPLLAFVEGVLPRRLDERVDDVAQFDEQVLRHTSSGPKNPRWGTDRPAISMERRP